MEHCHKATVQCGRVALAATTLRVDHFYAFNARCQDAVKNKRLAFKDIF